MIMVNLSSSRVMLFLYLTTICNAEQIEIKENNYVLLTKPDQKSRGFAVELTIKKKDDPNDEKTNGTWDKEEYAGYLSGHLKIILKQQGSVLKTWDVFINETTPPTSKTNLSCFRTEHFENLAFSVKFVTVSPILSSDFTANVAIVKAEELCKNETSMATVTPIVPAEIVFLTLSSMFIIAVILLGFCRYFNRTNTNGNRWFKASMLSVFHNRMSSQSPDSTVPPPAGFLASIARHLVFLPFIHYPLFPDLSDLSKYGLENSTHVFINVPITENTSDTNSRIGGWYIRPSDKSSKESITKLDDKDTIVLYLHGNAHNRAQPHRVRLYKSLVQLGFHVLAIDYRGYGDSSHIDLCEHTVVEDSKAALLWIHRTLGPRPKVIVHGHSLGTAISSRLVSQIEQENIENLRMSGLILEAPFNSMLDEVNTFIAAKILSYFINIEKTLGLAGVEFNSSKWLSQVKCPVLIVHAEDDGIVPHSLGTKLYQEVMDSGKDTVKMVSIPGHWGCGHKYLERWTQRMEVINTFTQNIGMV